MTSTRNNASWLVVGLVTAASGCIADDPADGSPSNGSGDETSGFKVGGTVSGLEGRGLVVRLNDLHDLPIAADGTFTFPERLANGSEFTVAVHAGPECPERLCEVANGAGTIRGGDAMSVEITCTVPRQRLLATSMDDLTLRVVNNVLAAPSNANAPVRTIGGSNTQLGYMDGDSVAMDPHRDVMYATSGDRILVFDNASVASGNVTPARAITLNGETRFHSVEVDAARDRLYATGQQALYIIDLASTRDGASPWAAKIFLDGAYYQGGITLDRINDRLYYAKLHHRILYSFDNASTLTSDSTPDRTMRWAGGDPRSIAIDGCLDRLYIGNSRGTDHPYNILVLDDASTLDGLTDLVGASSAALSTGMAYVPAVDIDSEGSLYYAGDDPRVMILTEPETLSGALTVVPDKILLGVTIRPRSLDVVAY